MRTLQKPYDSVPMQTSVVCYIEVSERQSGNAATRVYISIFLRKLPSFPSSHALPAHTYVSTYAHLHS
jgi:hypothetical protein